MSFLLALLTLPTAQGAMQSTRTGPVFELAAGVGAAGRPARFAVMGQASLGWWVGPYDDDYALGRFWAFVVTQRVDWIPSTAFRLAPMLELRRGMDLLVLAPHVFVAGGPLIAGQGAPLGVTARAGGGIKFRRTRRSGFVGRLEGGVDVVSGSVSPVVGITLGFGWSSPVTSTP